MVQTLSSPSALPYLITWDKLPDDFILPDEPVDNINQPSLAAALTERLANAGKLSATSLATTNYGLCARCDQKFVVKAPDWAYIAKLTVPKIQVERSDHRAWLRWWTVSGELVPWSSEQVQQEKERTNLERQRAESECLRADRLAALLRSQGIDPETI